MSRKQSVASPNNKAKLAKPNKTNKDELTNLMKEIELLEAQKQKLEQELKLKSETKPGNLSDRKNDQQALKEAANRWTDNIFAVKSWCKKKFMVEDKILNKQFGIPENLDYIP